MTKSALEAAYKGLLTRNRLRPDSHQQALVARLAGLQNELANTNNATLIHRHPPISGLYIYGSVGTGKSRIADLFTATLPQEITRRRVHFHEFMNDIHHRLHIARQSPNYSGDPLIQIGKTIRQESRVLCFDEFQLTDIEDAMIMARLFGSIWREGGVMVVGEPLVEVVRDVVDERVRGCVFEVDDDEGLMSGRGGRRRLREDEEVAVSARRRGHLFFNVHGVVEIAH